MLLALQYICVCYRFLHALSPQVPTTKSLRLTTYLDHISLYAPVSVAFGLLDREMRVRRPLESVIRCVIIFFASLPTRLHYRTTGTIKRIHLIMLFMWNRVPTARVKFSQIAATYATSDSISMRYHLIYNAL